MNNQLMSPMALALSAVFASAQSTWYVDDDATGPFEGTAAAPFRSLQQANDDPQVQHGDTLLVAPGRYEPLRATRRLQIRSTNGALYTSIESGVPLRTVDFPVAACGSELEGFTVYAGAEATAVRGCDTTLRRCILLGLGVADTGFFDTGDGWLLHGIVSGFEIGIGASVYQKASARNSVVWGNDLDGQGPLYWCVYGSEDPFLGGALDSIQADPQFVDFAGHDFHLAPGSPCIDAGDPSAAQDPDGSRSDIGLVPFDASYQPHNAYCTAKLNSLGCTPAIAATNTASISSQSPFWITCSQQLNHRAGLLFYGFAPKSTPYQGGYLCVQAPVRRTGLLDSGGNVGVNDCSGVFAVEFNSIIQSGGDASLEIGVEVFCQFWSRDSASSFTTNRSDALRFRLAP